MGESLPSNNKNNNDDDGGGSVEQKFNNLKQDDGAKVAVEGRKHAYMRVCNARESD